MLAEKFDKRLKNEYVNSIRYANDGLEGLIQVWLHKTGFILTWEECPERMQNDPNLYTRDERQVFDTYEELMAFFEKHGLSITSFTP